LVAVYSLGYRLGLLLAGALAPILADHLPWRAVYAGFALTMTLPILVNLRAPEPAVAVEPALDWRAAFRQGVIDPFAEFFRRLGWPAAGFTLAFLLLFKIPEQATVGGIMSPFYRDMGFSQTEIGAITKIYGVWIGMVGVFLGGAAVARFGVWRTLGAAIVLAGSSNLAYLGLSAHPGSLWVLTVVISCENLTLGLLGPPTVAYLSSLVSPRHTATQYALLSSLVNLPGKLLGFFAGGIVAATSYATYFVLTVFAIVPALVLWMALRGDDADRLPA
jgi:PAT family beta-lactamase induction signal transducer AmpG